MAWHGACLAAHEQLWALREQRGAGGAWETLGEVLEMLAVWGVTDGISAGNDGRVARKRGGVAAMRRRSVCRIRRGGEEAVNLAAA